MSDKTEAPTPRRLRKAREQGDSGVSAYAAQAIAFLVAVAVAPSAVGVLVARSRADLGSAIAYAATGGEAALRWGGQDITLAVLARVLPLLAAVGIAGGLAHALQTGGVVAASRLAPSLDRLNPIAGIGRLFSGERVFAVARSLAIGAVLSVLAYRELRDSIVYFGRIAGRPSYIGVVAADGAERFAWRVAMVGLALGVIDFVVTRRSWLGRLKMRKDEVKREHKESEGDPAVKAARERAYHELMTQATIASVKSASVVVVNPTHLACALRYDAGDEGEGAGEAPVVVASGEGDLAAQIVQAAQAWGIPVVRDVPLARALIELDVGDVIPEALYQAVAEILRELSDAEARS